MRWEGGAFLGGRLGFLLFYTLISGTTVALFGYTFFRRRLMQPIIELQRATDRIAGDVIEELAAAAPDETRQQYLDNLRWIRQAGANRMDI